MRMLKTLLRALKAERDGEPFRYELYGRSISLFPDGKVLPVMAGGDPEGDPEPDPEPTPDPEPDPDPDPIPDPEPDPDPDPDPDPEPFDKDRAMRTIKAQRAEEKKLKAERDAIKAERDALRQEKETEQERVVREADEAKVEAERLRATAEHLRIDIAIREAAAEADVPAARIRRVLKTIDRTNITVDSEGEVEGAETAVTELLDEVPELKGVPASDPDPNDPKPKPKPEPPGGNPPRKNKPKELSLDAVAKMAKERPEEFNRLMDEGKIPDSALSS